MVQQTRTRKNNPHERDSDKHPIRFNGEISFGTILSLAAMILSLYGFYNASSEKIRNNMEGVKIQLTQVETKTAIIETKVDAMWRSFQNTFGKTTGD